MAKFSACLLVFFFTLKQGVFETQDMMKKA